MEAKKHFTRNEPLRLSQPTIFAAKSRSRSSFASVVHLHPHPPPPTIRSGAKPRGSRTSATSPPLRPALGAWVPSSGCPRIFRNTNEVPQLHSKTADTKLQQK
jgi:hypothetical protein